MIKINGTDFYIDADESAFMLHKWDGQYRPSRGEYLRKKDCYTTYYSDFSELLSALNKKMLRQSISMSSTFEELKAEMEKVERIISGIDVSLRVDKPCRSLSE